MIAKQNIFDTSYSYYNNLPGRTLSSSIKQLVQLEIADELLEGIEYLAPGGSNTVQIPTYERNALHSSCSITENFSLFALLYEYKKTSSTQISKQLIILKYPVFAVDNLNTLMGYQTSNVYGRVIPNDGSGYGYVTSFRTTSIGTQKIGEYAYFYNREKIPCVFSSENVITSIDIDAINYFKIFSSNSRFFLCFPSHVIVWSYSSSSYQIISAANFDKAIFYYNTNNEFFKIENEIFRYDTSTNNFVLQGL